MKPQSIPQAAGLGKYLCFIALMASIGFFLPSCASTENAPTHEITAAEQSLSDAEQARVAEYALPELQEARYKLGLARAAVQDEDMLLAKRMAEQASADIQLASAKAELSKAQLVNEDIKNGMQVLETELNRSHGDEQ